MGKSGDYLFKNAQGVKKMKPELLNAILLCTAVILAILIVAITALPTDITTFGISLSAVIILFIGKQYKDIDPRYIYFIAAIILVVCAIIFRLISEEVNYALLIILASEITGIAIIK